MMPRPEYKKLYANAQKNPVIWGPKKAEFLADLWAQIEAERKMYVCKKAAAVENYASLAQTHLAESKRLYSMGLKEQNKANKLLFQITTSATDIQLLSAIEEATAEIMLLVFQIGCSGHRYGGLFVGMWPCHAFPQVPTEEYTIGLLEQSDEPKGSSTSFSLARTFLQAGCLSNELIKFKHSNPNNHYNHRNCSCAELIRLPGASQPSQPIHRPLACK
jgi:hypothetical protein